MIKFLLVFFGGGLGSALRYFFGSYLNNLETKIPYGTLLVNVFGSLLIGIFIGLSYKSNDFTQNHNLLFAVGFCGGFTTFSAFALENVQLLKNGAYLHFFGYTLATLILGFIAVFLGMFLVK